MERAFRTNIESVEEIRKDISIADIESFKKKRIRFKRTIQPLIKPVNGVLNGSTIKSTYFPSNTLEGFKYDFFISHSHTNEESALLLATWLESNIDCSCFVDSFVWKSADELLKELDDVYCYKKHTKTYDYKKRNFTTSHVHAILSMALLDTIKNSKYCIFIESEESISMGNGLKKKTFSPWLYEEIKFMTILQNKSLECFSMTQNSLNESLKIRYDVDDIEDFPFLNGDQLRNLHLLLKEP